ncbi:outer membrane efflux protein [Lucifera butyrica]|uniref:Outer membrane efflux protein n=1 Tax=Lucifera butyrica TaxID=1351585 RepID=A0A498R1J6_9FIRM|nr:TolC family protein [Lucifera butyrica]VBB06466.1 outer membrane efflux protein [Lucifera butyrica]
MEQIDGYRKILLKCFAVLVLTFLITPLTTIAAAVEPLNLDACVQLALTQNHGLQGFRLDLAAKQLQAKGAEGLAGPKVDLVGNYQWQEDPTAIIPAHGTNIPPVYGDQQEQWGFNLKQTLYDAGKTKSLIRYNAENADWQQVELKNQTMAVVNNVVKAFYHTLQLNDTITAEQDSVKALSSLADDIRMKYTVGRVAGVDVLQVEAQLAAEQEKLARYQSDYDRQVALLKSYIGYEQSQPLTVKGAISDYKAAAPVTGDIKDNPEVEKSRIRQTQSQELLTSAKADNNAQISLNGTYRVTAVPHSDASQDEMWTMGLQLSLPVFDGGVINANIRQTKIQLDRAKESYAQSMADAQAALAAAQANADAAKVRVESARVAWDRAKEAYRIMELSYKTGKTSLTDALVAQSAATNAEAVYYQAVYDEISARVDLKAVYGQTAYPAQ